MNTPPWALTGVWIAAALALAACTATGVIATSIEVLDYESNTSLVGWLQPGVERTFERRNEGGGYGGSTDRWLALRVVPSTGQAASCALRIESGGIEVGRATRGDCTVEFRSYGRPYVVHARTEAPQAHVEAERLESREALLRWRTAALALLVSALLAIVLTLQRRRATRAQARLSTPGEP